MGTVQMTENRPFCFSNMGFKPIVLIIQASSSELLWRIYQTIFFLCIALTKKKKNTSSLLQDNGFFFVLDPRCFSHQRFDNFLQTFLLFVRWIASNQYWLL